MERAGLYLRLSREDGEGESGSIESQRLLLRDYCRYLSEHSEIWCAPCAEVAKYFKSVKEG